VRAVVMRNRQLLVADVPTPEPGPGEVLVRTLACGICGSDLHAFRHAEDQFLLLRGCPRSHDNGQAQCDCKPILHESP